VINDLGFSGIGESDDYIIFGRHKGAHPYGGSYWQGLYFNKSNAGKNKIQEYDGIAGETVLLNDEWYYGFERYAS